jgi:hypothetical protein
MLAIEAMLRQLATLPYLAKVGLVVMAISGLADVMAHLEAHPIELVGQPHVHTSFEASAHLGGFASMVLILLGVALDGVQRSRAHRQAVEPQQESRKCRSETSSTRSRRRCSC